MKKSLILLVVTAMLVSSFSIGVFAAENKVTYTDVDASTSEGAAIYKLTENGIVEGNGDGTFAPKNSVTRAEFCKMVNNVWKYTEKSDTGFTDVNESHWYYNHVLIGKKAGYIQGFEDGTFRGENPVTREEACTFVCRVAGLYELPFTKAINDPVSDWAMPYVKKVLANGFIKLEAGDTLRATENMTRGEVASLLAPFVKTDVIITPNTGASTGGGSVGGGSVGGGGGNQSVKPTPTPTPNPKPNPEPDPIPTPEKDYTSENEDVVANLTIARNELSSKKSGFTAPQQQIINIMIDVIDNVVADKADYKISTSAIYSRYSADITEALEIYRSFDDEGRGLFASKISQLDNTVFNFLQDFFGIDFSDIG